MKDDFKNIIQSAFENETSEKAPRDIWSAIGAELDQSKIDVAVKDSFEGKKGKKDAAPEFVWENVQDQLDIDRVWIRIANSIKIRKYVSYAQYAALLLLLLLPFNLDIYTSEPTLVNTGSTSRYMEISMEVNRDKNDADAQLVLANTSSTELRTNQSRNSVNISNPIKSSQSPLDLLSENRTKPDVSISEYEKLDLLALNTIGLVWDHDIKPTFTPNKPRRQIGLLIGAVGTGENTWIIDNETRSGFDNGSLVQNGFSLGSSYGVFAEYQIKPRFSIIGEYLIQSRLNQKANLFQNGKYSLKEREVNSYRLAVFGGWNTTPKFYGVTHTTTVKFGGYYSGIKSDYTRIDGVLTKVNDINEGGDIGLHFELGKRIYLKSFVLDGGIRADYGLLNVASKKSNIPAHLNYTRMVSGGLYLKLAYTF
ncbi:MAG: hypothetical protein ACFHU9_18180 [Fluviicola sp.]